MSMKLENYLKRIEWKGRVNADLQTLKELHYHHATHIPFENLDIQLGRNISLEPEALERKIVENGRGGYCFEQNTLLQAVLQEIGFDVIACEARVRMGKTFSTPRTHMLLIVNTEGKEYLADVGFGGDGLFYPLELNENEQKQFLWKYRIMKEESNLFVLQTRTSGEWLDLYAFVPEKREPVDFELANWYTSTHPKSWFVQGLTAQLPTPEARYILRNRTFIIDYGTRQESRTLESALELIAVLRNNFRLSFPDDTHFHNPEF